MIMALPLQIFITYFLLITATASSRFHSKPLDAAPSSASPPDGFTIELTHRRSNSSSSRLSNDVDGSSPYADTVFNDAAYLMKLQIGTPPVEIEAEIDTGSNIVWTQCQPCDNCYNQQAPIFDPSKSSTYKDKMCHDGPCPYEAAYADKSYTMGTYAFETVTIQSTSGQPFVMPETLIGCGHNNSGFPTTSSGIVGLGWGSSSLIHQMGERFLGLLSYCFSGKGTSKINFGRNALVAGDGTVAANMFIKTEKQGFYYLNLEAISVGDNRIETLGTPFHALEGNIIIDSGSTYTYLPDSYCKKVKEAVASVVKADRGAAFSADLLCYNSDTIDVFPAITMHFSGGADLVLDKYNTYLSYGGMYCLAFMCSTDPTAEAIFGNRAQNNFLEDIGLISDNELTYNRSDQSMGRKSKSIANRRVARMNVGETSKSRSQEAVETLKRFQHLNMHDTDSSSEKWLQKQEDQDALLLKAENLRSEIDYLEYSKEWLLNQEEHDALRLKAEKLRSELDDLQILNDRLCGEGVEAMTLTELRSLIGQLKQGLLSVRNQLAKKKIELEEFERNMVKQELGEEEDTDTDAGKLLIRTKREHGLVIQKRLCRSRTYIRKIARGLRTRGETRKHWDDCETLIRSVRYMKKEIPRLRLLNRRMLGEEIDGLDYFELMILRKEIHNGIGNMGHWIVRKLWAENERLGKKVSM